MNRKSRLLLVAGCSSILCACIHKAEALEFAPAWPMPNGAGIALSVVTAEELGAVIGKDGGPTVPQGINPAMHLYLPRINVNHDWYEALTEWHYYRNGYEKQFRLDNIVVAQLGLPGAKQLCYRKRESDWAHLRYDVRGERTKDRAAPDFCVIVSRLSPAVLLQLTGVEEVELLMPQTGIRHAAWSDGQTVHMCDAPLESTLAGVERGWLLLWRGVDTGILTCGVTKHGHLAAPNEYVVPDGVEPVAGDVPLLFLFSQAPTLRLDGAGGEFVSLSFFPECGARILVLPLAGCNILPVATTGAWGGADGLPDAVRRQCDWWAAHGAYYPVGVTESFAYDAKADTVSIRHAFRYEQIREGQKTAPVPPIAELARRKGFTVTLAAMPDDSGTPTVCGPYAVVPNAEACELRIQGMGKYAWETPVVKTGAGNADDTAPRLRGRLDTEIGKVLQAGHLAPFHLPPKSSWGWWAFQNSTTRLLYSRPGQGLSALARALPFLDAAKQQAVRNYLQTERRQYPPEKVAHLPSDAGSRREGGYLPEFAYDPAMLQKYKGHMDTYRSYNFHVRNQLAIAGSLYDLATYYLALGKAQMEEDGFDLAAAAANTVMPYFQRSEWATCGWYSWPPNLRDGVDLSYGRCRTHEVNEMLAACIGLARLARLAGDAETETLAMGMFSRFALNRYGRTAMLEWLLHDVGIFRTPPGYEPADDPLDVHLDEAGVLLHGMRFGIFLSEEGPYVNLVPETGRFFKDHAARQAAAFARDTADFYPDAFMTLASPRNSSELWHNFPQDGHQAFLGQAWILGKEPDWLRRRLDVPLVPVGDWYYIDKLVAALEAHSGVEWKETLK